jgi:ABC transporter with metal-binding/Fe-S-binding domain ATP-binding protein
VPKQSKPTGKKLIVCYTLKVELKLGALFSGGKDSTFAIYQERLNGHEVVCLITIFPRSDESHLLHYPNISATALQSKSMGIPQIIASTDSDESQTEIYKLQEMLEEAKAKFGIEGIVHGGIQSDYQKKIFDTACKKLNLQTISPLWHINQLEYLHHLIESKFRFIVTSVSSEGLDDSWLGKEITIQDIQRLNQLATKYGFNVSFEGGEAETFVIGCPIFSRTLKIIKSKKTWDGYRGRFEITEAVLEH